MNFFHEAVFCGQIIPCFPDKIKTDLYGAVFQQISQIRAWWKIHKIDPSYTFDLAVTLTFRSLP